MKQLTLPAFLFLLWILTAPVAGCRSTDSVQSKESAWSTECVSSLTANCEAGYAKVNDITMYYELHGQGEPLLLLHGGTGSIESFKGQIPTLAEHFRVIAPDSRGHGRTTDSGQPLSYALMADDMLALLDVLGIDKAPIVGWSDGGIIGLDIAMRHPERLDKLVTIGANYSVEGLREEFVEWLQQVTAETWPSESVEFYRTHAPDPSHWPIFFDKVKTMWRTQPNYRNEDLERIRVPTLVVAGEGEEVVRGEHTETMAGALPKGELKIIPGAGHGAPVEKPEEVNAAIIEFLKSETM